MSIIGPIIIAGATAAITNIFQKKRFKHEKEAKKLAEEKNNAMQLFQVMSTDMDNRLYCIRRVYWGINDEAGEDELTQRWMRYSEILYKWNSALNKNLIMVERYFGLKMMKKLKSTLKYKLEDGRDAGFNELGKQIEDFYYEVDQRKDFDHEGFGEVVDDLKVKIHRVNKKMIRDIQDGCVGVFHPDVD